MSLSTVATLDALLEEMDAEKGRPGQRCRTCLLSAEQRAFVAMARNRGHSYASISKKLRTALGIEIGEHSLMKHVNNGHEARHVPG